MALAGGSLLCAGSSSHAGVNLPEYRSSRGTLIMKTHLQAILWGLMICLVVFSFQWIAAPRALAQDADEDEAAATDEEAPAKKGGKKGGAAEAPEGGGEKNFLMWIIEVSGLIGLVLLILSIYFVATVVRMFMELRPEVFTPLEV